MSAAKRRTVSELRAGLAHATEQLRTLRQTATESRDQRPKHSRFWFEYEAEARSYSLSLHVLFCNTGGEFGEDFTDGAS